MRERPLPSARLRAFADGGWRGPLLPASQAPSGGLPARSRWKQSTGLFSGRSNPQRGKALGNDLFRGTGDSSSFQIMETGTVPYSKAAPRWFYFTTLIFTLAFLPLAVLTVIVAVPRRLAVTTPDLLFTEATLLREEEKVILLWA